MTMKNFQQLAKSENHGKYLELLRAILDNAENLKVAGSELLKASLKIKKKEKKKAIWSFSQFMFYSSVEKCGKFLLVLDEYPREISGKILKEIGFYSHDKKIDRVITNWSNFSGDVDISLLRNKERMRKLFRMVLREQSLYVDFKDGKVEIPTPRSIANKNLLNNLIKIVVNILQFCRIRLNDFQSNPVNFLN